MVKGLLFDLDGVVIDSESYNDKACADLLAEFNEGYDRDFLKPRMVGKSDIEGMNLLVEHHKLPISGEEFDIRRKENKKRFYEKEIPYMQGFESFFEKLKSHFNCPVAIVTACNKEYFDLIDLRLKISDKFNHNIFRSEMVKKHKPAPDVYLYAGEKLNIDCKDCLVFEDAPAGIVSGIRAGSKVIALTTTFSKETIINTIKEIDETINVDEILFIDKFEDNSLKEVINFSEN
ncbi:MAG: HAD-IA family hydrolase [Candidatus Nanoarchaeia archaeon]|nr:HAD-IA family hydrolase [Candidatus Nanoarchaeia archaeon]